MPDRFPHLDDSSTFPSTDNINVYKYPNTYDYGRYDATQMTITLCSVPWDLGEAHVGQRTITGVGNVVDFGSTNERNAYFDGLSDEVCYRFKTKYRHFHAGDEQIKVPVPVTALADYNYLEVAYEVEPDTETPLEYETNRISRWYYFIRDFEQAASNTTVCNLMIDTWQTYIYYVDIPYMYLERGHYPLAQVDADTYLANPLANSEWLQGAENSYGDITQEASTSYVCLNDDDVMACIATSGIVTEDSYGTVHDESDWQMYAARTNQVQGAPSVTVFCMAGSDLATFLNTIDGSYPQLKQSIQGVFFVSQKLLTLGTERTFAGVTIWELHNANPVSFQLVDLDRDMWGYPDEYADLAKLYTYPYTALDLYTESGNAVRVHVEDTTGTLSVITRLQLTFPWITIDAHVSGYGSNTSETITYHNVDAHTFTFGGLWYETLTSWGVPIYGVVQSMDVYNGFATYWSREQNAYAASNTRSNANASAETALENANARASTDLANANAEADTTVANAAVQTSANSSINSESNSCANAIASQDQSYSTAIADLATSVSTYTTAATTAADEQQATISQSSAVVSSAANGVMSGAASGGLIGAVVGGVSGLVSGGISAATTSAQTEVGIALTESQNTFNNYYTDGSAARANTATMYKTSEQVSANTANTGYQNDAITSTAANSAALTNANAARDYATDTANAQRDYNTAVANATRDYNTAIEANNNQIREARLGAPQLYGNLADGDTGVARPQAYFVSIVKQPTGAIAQAGDQFLRYGYVCNRVVPFDGFNIMPKFTYWQCSDMWLRSSTVPDAYMDEIRLLLFGGVTVWRDPADIGNVSIYENK